MYVYITAIYVKKETNDHFSFIHITISIGKIHFSAAVEHFSAVYVCIYSSNICGERAKRNFSNIRYHFLRGGMEFLR